MENLKYLDELEAKSIYIIREAYRNFKGHIAALVSWGKDSVTGDAELYYKIDNKLYYSTIEEMFRKITPKERWVLNGKEFILPKEKVEVLSLEGKKFGKIKVCWKPVRTLIRHKTKKQVFKFTTSTKLSIKTTGDHSLVKPSDYLQIIEARKLKKGDSLIGVNDYNFDVPDIKYINGIKITPRLLVLMGLWFADGCYAKGKRIIISTGGDKEVLEFLKKFKRKLSKRERIYLEIRKKFGKIPKRLPYKEVLKIAARFRVKKSNVYYVLKHKDKLRERLKNRFVEIKTKANGDVWIYSKSLVDTLKKLGCIYKNKKKVFPKWLLVASNKQIGYFLAGFIQGDGSCSKNGVFIYNANLNIIKSLRVLLTRLGIQHGMAKHNAQLSGFKSNSEYLYSINIRSIQGLQRFKQVIPQIFTKLKKVKIDKNKKKCSKYPISYRKIEKIEKLRAKTRVFYDLEVEDTNLFIANNLVCHNSTTMLYLIKKAFFGEIPFPVLHIDTSYKFKEIYEFRDKLKKEWGFELIIAKNEEALKAGMGPWKGRLVCCTALKTEALKQAIEKYKFKALLAAIRRDEHVVRAKERYFSPRDKDFHWNYLKQPPELWEQFNVELDETQTHLRVHPMLHWREIDIWRYIKREKIPVVPLYFSGYKKKGYRYRSIGCEPCVVPVPSEAKTIDEIIEELKTTKIAERAGRVQDKEKAFMMQKLRALGYM